MDQVTSWRDAQQLGMAAWKELLAQLSQLARELAADGAARLRHWARAPALPRDLRRLAVQLQERWRQMTLHQRESGIPNSTNWLAGRFGRIKPHYRMTRGAEKPERGG